MHSATVEIEINKTTEAILSRLGRTVNHSLPQPLFEDLADFVLGEWESALPIRGYLTQIGYTAGGGRVQDVVDVATAVEIMQVATLLIDDVIDEADVRNGLSVYKRFGKNIGVITGEILKSAASTLLADALSTSRCFTSQLEALRQFERVYEDVCLSQLLDLAYESSFGISEAQYLKMIRFGTAGFLEGSIGIGCILSGVKTAEERILRQYARMLGFALQIHNDIVDLVPQSFCAKTFANDIKRRKQRLPLIHFLKNCTNTKDKKDAQSILGGGHITDRDVRHLIELMVRNGSLDYAGRRAAQFSSRAKAFATRTTPESNRDLLVQLVDLIQPV